MNVSTDPIRLAFDQYIDQVRRDEPAALATADLAGHVRNWIVHRPLWCESHELLAELKDSPGRYGPPETRAMLVALEPGPGAGGPRKIAFFLFVETLAAIAAVECTSLGAPAARRLRARTSTADTNAVWERWLELCWQKPGEGSADSSEPSRSPLFTDAAFNPLDHVTRTIAALLDADADAGPLSVLLAPPRARPGGPARSGQQSGRAEQPESTVIATLPSMPTRVTATQRSRLAADLRRRYDAGESIRALAASTGRSYGFVHRILTETGVSLRGRRHEARRGHRHWP